MTETSKGALPLRLAVGLGTLIFLSSVEANAASFTYTTLPTPQATVSGGSTVTVNGFTQTTVLTTPGIITIAKVADTSVTAPPATDNFTINLSIPVNLTNIPPPGAAGSGTITVTGTLTFYRSDAGGELSLFSPSSPSFSATIGGVTYTLSNLNYAAPTVNVGTGALSGLLTAIAAPTLTKSFGATTIDINGTTTLTFNLSNQNATTLTGINFSDTLPAGLVVSGTSGLPNGTCGGTITAAGSSIMVSGATLTAGASCTFAVNVTGTAAGPITNTTSAVGAVQASGGVPATAAITVAPIIDTNGAFQVRYAANLAVGDSVINITNTGASSTTALPTQNGNLCVNAYAFSPDEQLISCCSCLVTPNGLASLSARNDLISNTLTPGVPTSIVVKLLASAQATCNPSTVTPASLALGSGLAAWGTTIHSTPVTAGTPAGTFGLTETPFTPSTLSVAELTRLTSLCGFNQINGSGFGICKACRLGALGADRQ